MPLLEEVAVYLQSAGITADGTRIFRGSIPLEAPDAMIALIELGGESPVRTHDTPVSRYERPHLQVLIRGEPRDYAAARVKAQDVWIALELVRNMTLSGTFYLAIEARSSPRYLLTDDYARPTIVFDIRCLRSL